MIRKPGRAATRLEQIQIAEILVAQKRKHPMTPCNAYIQYIIHHITENTPHKLQVEVECRLKFWHHNEWITTIKFERVFL